MVRFEKSGAPFLNKYISVIDCSTVTLGVAMGPNLSLLEHHLRVALLVHVRGFGRRRRAGATMI